MIIHHNNILSSIILTPKISAELTPYRLSSPSFKKLELEDSPKADNTPAPISIFKVQPWELDFKVEPLGPKLILDEDIVSAFRNKGIGLVFIRIIRTNSYIGIVMRASEQ